MAFAELAGPVGHHDGLAQKALLANGAPKRRLACDPHRIGRDSEIGETEGAQMAHPVGFAVENARGMAGELVDERLGEVVIPHVGQRRLVDDVISRPAAQALKKRLARFALPSAKDGEIVRADLGGHAGLAAMAGAGVVDCDIGRAFEAGVQHRGVLGLEGFELGGQKAHHLALRDRHPMP